MNLFFRNILFLALLVVCPCLAHAAKEVRYHIDEECMKLYEESRRHRNSPECLEYYRKMMNLAREKNDRYAQCQALCIPMQYYYYNGTEQQFFQSLNALRTQAKKINAPSYYYWCFTEEIRYYIYKGRSFKALNLVNNMMEELEKQPSDYGRFACYVALSEAYMARRDEVHARENLLKALDIQKKVKNNFDLPIVYLNLARITEASDTVSRGNYLRKALKYSINPTDSASALMGLAYMMSNVNKDADFMRLYERYRPMLEREGLAAKKYDKWYKSNEAYRLVLDGKTDSANIVRQTIIDPYLRYQAMADYYGSDGDVNRQVRYLDSLVFYLRSSQSSQNIADVAEINTIYETDLLRIEANNVRQRFSRNILKASLVLVILLAVFLFVWLQRKRVMSMRLQALSDELRQARDEAVQASKMKDVFIQNMSHEVRTPLNAVTGFAQLLALPSDMFTDDERKEFGEHIQNNTHLLTMLIDDILNISDVESGNYKMVISPYRVNEICNIAMSTIRYRVPEDVELQFETELDDEYSINTDARRVQQVLINYLTNAIKHTEKGHIRLKVSNTENKGFVTFSVADTGTGIPFDKSEDVFKRFEKLNAFKQGTGLGLNICRIIAEKLDGRCYLDTNYPESSAETDHGARFIFELPVEMGS